MFITKDDVTIALDTIATVGLGSMEGNRASGGEPTVIYWISFYLKDTAGFLEKKDPYNTNRTSKEVRFHYGVDKVARDTAYQNFVNKFSTTLE